MPDAVSDVAATKEESKKSPAKPGNALVRKKGARSAEERSNKTAEVLAMMKRAKGATLAEIMEATGWQAHTVRGFVSILGKIESSARSRGRCSCF